MKTHIVIEGNAFYEVDEECLAAREQREKNSEIREKNERREETQEDGEDRE